MKLISVLRGQAIRTFKARNPLGGLYVADIIKAIQHRYRFFDIPKSLKEADMDRGVTFRQGKFTPEQPGPSVLGFQPGSDIVIETLQMFKNGIVVETTSSVEHSDMFIEDFSKWAMEDLRIRVESTGIKKSFASEVEVELHPNFNSTLSKLKPIVKLMNELLDDEGIYKDHLPYEASSFSLHCDTSQLQTPVPGPFIVDRRMNEPHSSNIYFSSAPLTTANHLLLLEAVESLAP